MRSGWVSCPLPLNELVPCPVVLDFALLSQRASLPARSYAMGVHFRCRRVIVWWATLTSGWWQGQRCWAGERRCFPRLHKIVEDTDLERKVPDSYHPNQKELQTGVAVQCLPCHELLGQGRVSDALWQHVMVFGVQRCPTNLQVAQHCWRHSSFSQQGRHPCRRSPAAGPGVGAPQAPVNLAASHWRS